MKPFVAIVKSTAGVLDKYQDFDTEAEADAHVLDHGGFVVPDPGGTTDYWVVDNVAKTVTHDQAAADEALRQRKRNVLFDNFEDRFTPSEWDDATDFIYEVDTVTGKPKRRVLLQGLARAQARNRIDLLGPKTDAFMNALVGGGVITAQRKAAILTP